MALQGSAIQAHQGSPVSGAVFVQPLRQYFLARTALAGNQYRRGRSGDAIGLGQQPYDLGILGDKLYGRRLTGCMGRIAGRGDPR